MLLHWAALRLSVTQLAVTRPSSTMPTRIRREFLTWAWRRIVGRILYYATLAIQQEVVLGWTTTGGNEPDRSTRRTSGSRRGRREPLTGVGAPLTRSTGTFTRTPEECTDHDLRARGISRACGGRAFIAAPGGSVFRQRHRRLPPNTSTPTSARTRLTLRSRDLARASAVASWCSAATARRGRSSGVARGGRRSALSRGRLRRHRRRHSRTRTAWTTRTDRWNG